MSASSNDLVVVPRTRSAPDDNDEQPLRPPTREPRLVISASCSSPSSEQNEENVIEVSKNEEQATNLQYHQDRPNEKEGEEVPRKKKGELALAVEASPQEYHPDISNEKVGEDVLKKKKVELAPAVEASLQEYHLDISKEKEEVDYVSLMSQELVDKFGNKEAESSKQAPQEGLALSESSYVSSQQPPPIATSPGAVAVPGSIDCASINDDTAETSVTTPSLPPQAPEGIVAHLVPEENEIAELVQRQLESRLQQEVKDQLDKVISTAAIGGVVGESGWSRRTIHCMLAGLVLLIGAVSVGTALAVTGGNNDGTRSTQLGSGEKPQDSLPTSSPIEVGLLGDGELCTSSNECSTGCCSSVPFQDGQLKCTPPADVEYKYDVCKNTSDTVLGQTGGGLLSQWAFCGYSAQCSNRCCSTNSADGRLRCIAQVDDDPYTCIDYMPIKSLNITLDVDIEATIVETIEDTFDRYYGYIQSVYNPGATTVVNILIQENWDEIPVSVSGDTVILRSVWLKQNPLDVAGLTIRSLANVVQHGWPNVPDYFVSGLADYIRDATGVDIAIGNSWSIPDGYEEGQTYKDGGGTVAAFVKWMVGSDLLVLEDLISTFQDGSYSDDATWIALTGENLDNLWGPYSVALPGGGTFPPTLIPSRFPSQSPSQFPSPSPLQRPIPTPGPTPKPTLLPSRGPTPKPTSSPSQVPTPKPSPFPTRAPTPRPTLLPTPLPTPRPTPKPSAFPTPYPSRTPSQRPSPLPTRYTTPEFKAMLQRLGKDNGDDLDTLTNPATVQYQAVNWLATEDTWSSSTNFPTQAMVERYALAVLYLSTQGTTWTAKFPFLDGASSVCEWTKTFEGVTCDVDNLYVQELNLINVNVQGSIPTELALLSSLKLLWLDENTLFGHIPTELFQLTKLTSLSFRNCALEGTIPSGISKLSNMQNLYLDQNLFTGTIPRALGNMTKLTELWFGVNQLDGTIPTKLGALTQLAILDTATNNFRGTIPTELGLLTSMQYLYLEQNQFRGTFPTELGRLANLVYLWAHENDLTGTIPTEFANMPQLSEVYLNDNNFVGSIDEIFCAASFIPNVWADCWGDNPEILCSCCTACCDNVLC